MEKLLVQTLDGARYADTFAAFVKRRSDHQYRVMVDRLVDETARLPEGFTCLDVGAGTGRVVTDWVARGGRRLGQYVAIEPNAAHARALRATCAELSLEATVDEVDFSPNYAVPGKFDLVLFSHSLYCTPAPIDCVVHAFDFVARGGLLVVFLQGPFGVHPMCRLFEPLFQRDRPPIPQHDFSSAELVLGMRGRGLRPQVRFDPSPLDLTGFFEASNQREQADFLSFCLQIEFDALDDATGADILTYLRAACIEDRGRLLWHAPNATITVHKDRQ